MCVGGEGCAGPLLLWVFSPWEERVGATAVARARACLRDSTRGRRVLLKKSWLAGCTLPGAPQLPLTVPTPQQVFPTVVGDMDSSGSLNAQVLLLLAERLRAKAVFQVTRASCLHPQSQAAALGWGLEGGAGQ